LAVFRRFFERIVEECEEAGLVWGEELFFDATKVEANASIDSTRSRSLVEGHLEKHLAGAFPEDTPFAQEEDLPGAVVAGFVGPEVDREQRAPGAGVAQVGLQEDGGSQGEHHRPRRLPNAPEEGREQARLPDPLPRGRG
jgi:hypothetical protein